MSLTMKEKWERRIIPFLMETLGGILVAVALDSFAVNAQFPLTGFSGIALIFNRLFGLPLGATIVVLNIPLALLCYKLLGKGFFFRSIRCMIISSFFIDYIGPMFPAYDGDRLLAALCTGVIMGIGYALIYMQNSSTGGADFMVMALKSLHPHLSLGKLVFLTDFVIVMAGGILFKDVDGVIYGMIVNFIFSAVIDKVMYGANAGKLTLIVTDHGDRFPRPSRIPVIVVLPSSRRQAVTARMTNRLSCVPAAINRCIRYSRRSKRRTRHPSWWCWNPTRYMEKDSSTSRWVTRTSTKFSGAGSYLTARISSLR